MYGKLTSRNHQAYSWGHLIHNNMIGKEEKQKGVPLSTMCGVKWKNLHRIILSRKLGED